MRKYFLLLSICVFMHLYAEEEVSSNAVIFRVAYFRPESKIVREIYSDGWADYQLEYTRKIGCNLLLWAGASGFCQHGHSLGLDDRTRIRLIPLSLGVKYLFNINPCFDIYLGGGACYSYLRIKDDSPFVHRHPRKQALGAIAQLGLYYYLSPRYFFNVFADYYYQRYNFSPYSRDPLVQRHDLNISGVKVGGGIGVNF